MAVTQKPKKRWTPDRDLPGPLKVSSWPGYVKKAFQALDGANGKKALWPSWLKPSDKPFREQTMRERMAAPLKFAVRALTKLVVAAGIAGVGIVAAGAIGGTAQTFTGLGQILAGFAGQGPGVFTGLGNLFSGLIKLGAVAAIVFTGGGAPVIAAGFGAAGPAVSALSAIPYVGGPISTGISWFLAHAATAFTVAHSALVTGSTFVAGNVAAHGLLAGAATGSAIVAPSIASAATGAIVDKISQRKQSAQAQTNGTTATQTQNNTSNDNTSNTSSDLGEQLTSVNNNAQTQQNQLGGNTQSAITTQATSAAQVSSNKTLTSVSPVAISDEQKKEINERIKGYGELSIEQGAARFTGKDPIGALANCKNSNLQKQTYTLSLPSSASNQTISNYLKQAEKSNISISKIKIADGPEYSVPRNKDGSYGSTFTPISDSSTTPKTSHTSKTHKKL